MQTFSNSIWPTIFDYHKLLDQSLSHCFSSSILSNFRQYFNNILANKPANPPDFDVYEDLIDKKAANAKSKIDATAGASAAEKAAAKAQVYSYFRFYSDECCRFYLSVEESLIFI